MSVRRFKPYSATTSCTMSVHSVIAPIPATRNAVSPVSWRGEEPGPTNVAARQLLADRPVHLVPELVAHDGELLGRQRVRVHVCVHRREQVDGHEGGESAKKGGLQGRIEADQRGCDCCVERKRHTSMLSQIPCVSLASVLTEQGATRTTSAHRRSCKEVWKGRVRTETRSSRSGEGRTSMCSTGSPISFHPCSDLRRRASNEVHAERRRP